MRKFALTAALGAACLGLAACSGGGEGNAAGNNEAGAMEGEGNGGAGSGAEGNGGAMGGEGNGASGTGGAGGNSATSNWPSGARIVQEDGVTYRVEANGTRVRLTDRDARIVVENGVRYRVDAGGTRVRINEQGIDLPDVDIGVNKKGNLDVDVGDRDPDGGR